MRPPPPGSDRGSALLLVLWLTLALGLLVSILAATVNEQIENVSWERKKAKAGALSDAALAFLPKLLEQDRIETARLGGEHESRLDLSRFTGEWRSGDFALGDGKFRIVVRDAEQKLNVNLAPRVVWENFLEMTSFSPDESRTWLDSLEDWIDENDLFRLNGAEDTYYEALIPPYRPKNGPLSSLGEIYWIRKGPDLLASRLNPDLAGSSLPVAEFLTLDGDGRVNVNTAPPVILAALGHVDIATAEAWVRERNGADGTPGTEDDKPLETALFEEGVLPMITTQSKYFVVEGIGEVHGVTAVRRALFIREGNELKKVRNLTTPIS